MPEVTLHDEIIDRVGVEDFIIVAQVRGEDIVEQGAP